MDTRALTASRLDRIGVLAWLILTLVAAGCGSGSSGFDPDPEIVERDAILNSASTRSCTSGPGAIEICASGAPIDLPFVPADPDGAVLLANPIETAEGPDIPSCNGRVVPCMFGMELRQEALPAGTMVLALIRPEDLSVPWRTSRSLVAAPPGTASVITPSFVTNLPPGTPIITAVLVFPAGDPRPSVGPIGIDVHLLADLGAVRAGVVLGLSLPD